MTEDKITRERKGRVIPLGYKVSEEDNKLLVISVLINVTNKESVNSNFFEMFLHNLPTSSEVEKQIDINESISL